jgi:hypothetical protein
MSKKLKCKKKKSKQKNVLKVPQQPSPPPIPIVAKSQTQFWTLLGIVIGLISLIALIELFPRLSSAAASPTNPDDILGSSKFTVSNDGYLRVIDVMSACFLWNVQFGKSPGPAAHIGSGLVRIVQPPQNKLSPTEGYTIPCTPEGNPVIGTSPPYKIGVNQADLAIVAYYRVWPFTFYRDHRLFRFVAHFGKQGEVTWEKQPAAVLEPDFDRWITEHGGTFPPQSRRPGSK